MTMQKYAPNERKLIMDLAEVVAWAKRTGFHELVAKGEDKAGYRGVVHLLQKVQALPPRIIHARLADEGLIKCPKHASKLCRALYGATVVVCGVGRNPDTYYSINDDTKAFALQYVDWVVQVESSAGLA